MRFEDIKKGDRTFSSYLFVGPDGSGKFSAAKNFAKDLNCTEKTKNTACGSCASCAGIDSATHPDVFSAEPKGRAYSIGIDEIREVIRRANLKPYGGGKKVFIINEAHTMKREAQNAFLKTLEEVPGETIFILISRAKDLVLSTIRSRCHVVNFSGEARLDKFPPERLEEAMGMQWEKKEDLKENMDILASFFRDMFLYKATGREEMFFHPAPWTK